MNSELESVLSSASKGTRSVIEIYGIEGEKHLIRKTKQLYRK
jgi:hypothetical protein